MIRRRSEYLPACITFVDTVQSQNAVMHTFASIRQLRCVGISLLWAIVGEEPVVLNGMFTNVLIMLIPVHAAKISVTCHT